MPEAGECYKCFRTVPLDASRAPAAPLPVLRDIQLPRHPHAPVSEAMRSVVNGSNSNSSSSGSGHSVRAIIGRISQSNLSYLVTAGTDRSIRFWDFVSPGKCYTVSGLEAAQPKSIFDMPKLLQQQQAGEPVATGMVCLLTCYLPMEYLSCCEHSMLN